MRRAFAIGVSVLVGVACSSGERHQPPLPNTYGGSPGGTVGTAGDGGTSASLGPAVSGSCPSGMYDFDQNSGFMGDTSIAGTVTFSTPLKANHKIVMSLYQFESNGGGLGGFGSFELHFPDDRMSFTYRFTNIDQSDYAVEVQGDVGGMSDEPTDPGDMVGFYPGTASGPIQDVMQATRLPIPPCYDKVDFGAAPK